MICLALLFLIWLNNTSLFSNKVLWEKLKRLSPERLNKLSVCGASEEGVQWLRTQSSSLKLLSKNRMLNDLIQYELLGFTGYIPEEMKNAELRIPLKYAKFLWGWPNKFMERMKAVNTRVELIAGGSNLSEGFDHIHSIKDIPEGFDGYIWTNKINELHLKGDKE